MTFRRFLLPLLLLAARPAFAAEWEHQLDPYYTAVDCYVALTTAPIPKETFTSEKDLYKKLMFMSPIPRFMLLEASVNPLPLAGVWIRRQAPRFYADMQLTEDLNAVKAVTTGFEEPGAVAVFFGNIVDFKPVKKRSYAEGRGHVGLLASAGNYHIKDNQLYKDDWIETEWKVKGDRNFPDVKLGWSFRLGAKFHARRGIADVYYIGLRRSRTDYQEKRRLSWFHNSGIMYKFDFSQRSLTAVQHHFVVDKKFPMKGGKIVPSLAVGFIWRGADKYSRDLKDAVPKTFEFLFQPNISF